MAFFSSNTTSANDTDLPLVTTIAATVGSLATSTTTNAGLALDGFQAGYHGTKLMAVGERDRVRALLIEKYQLQNVK